MQPCIFCSGDADEPGHRFRCDGRQGTIEARPVDVPLGSPVWDVPPPAPAAEPPPPVDEDTHRAAILDALAALDAYARATDPDTSHGAARRVRGQTRRTQYQHILLVLDGHALLSDEQIRDAVQQQLPLEPTPSGLRTRRAELVRAGLVIDSGQRGTTATGRRTILWRRAS